MCRRWKVVAVSLAYSVIVLLWGSLSPARAADGLSTLSEQPSTPAYQEPAVPKYRPPTPRRSFTDPASKPTYQEPVVPKYRPPTPRRSFTDPAPKSLPLPSGEALHGTTADIGQTEKVAVPSRRVAPVDPSKTGPPTIIGRVLFRGVVPPPNQIEVTRDVDICGSIINQQLVSTDPATGGLRDAIVHVDAGMAEVAAGPSSPDAEEEGLSIRNKNCGFLPRLGVGRTGIDAKIFNDDPLMHNTNIVLGNRTVLNVALVAGGSPIRKQLKKAGLLLVKCNVHKFMYGYRYVFDDLFFDMTTEAGQFRISNLPPGLHMVTVWHETLGSLQKEIQVPAQGTVNLDFEFK